MDPDELSYGKINSFSFPLSAPAHDDKVQINPLADLSLDSQGIITNNSNIDDSVDHSNASKTIFNGMILSRSDFNNLENGSISMGITEATFKQIEIPDFDEFVSPPTPTRPSHKSINNNNDNINNNENNSKMPESQLTRQGSKFSLNKSSSSSNFSFPPKKNESDHNKTGLSRIGSIRSLRHKISQVALNSSSSGNLSPLSLQNSHVNHLYNNHTPLSQVPSNGNSTYKHTIKASPVIKQPPLTIKSKFQINNSDLIPTDHHAGMKKLTTNDLKTASEYTMHMIFTQFIRLSERKLSAPEIAEPELTIQFIQSFDVGNDPVFDKVISSLGYIAKKQLQQVVDCVMYWRKLKNDIVHATINAYNNIKAQYEAQQRQVRGDHGTNNNYNHHNHSPSKYSLHNRNTSNQSTSTVLSFTKQASHHNSHDINHDEIQSLHTLKAQLNQARKQFCIEENRAQTCSYIVCRVLTEVISQTPFSTVELAFYNTLEDNIYQQVKSIEKNSIVFSAAKHENWIILTKLVGIMSDKRFSRISDRFIADLEKVPDDVTKHEEANICLLIRSMKCLKLKNFPLEEFEECCGFLASLAKFFSKSNNYMIISSYMETLSDLILPLCGMLNAETDLPVWVDVTRTILQKINNSIEKSRYWDTSFTLMCICLTVSPKQVFSENWFDLIKFHFLTKLNKSINQKDANEYASFSSLIVPQKCLHTNASRITLLKALTRTIWTYIFKYSESLNKTTKKLETIFGMLNLQSTSSKKQQWLSPDKELLKPLVVLLRSIGYSNLNYAMESLLVPIAKVGFNYINLESLSQEKCLIVIKAYLWILIDLVTNQKPPYPTNENIDTCFETPIINFNDIDILEILNSKNVNENDITYHQTISRHFGKLLLVLEKEVGAGNWQSSTDSMNSGSGIFGTSIGSPTTNNGLGSSSSNGHTVNGSLSSNSEIIETSSPLLSSTPSFLSSKSSFAHYFSSYDSNLQVMRKQLTMVLFEKILEAAPWFYQLSNTLSYMKLVEILTKNCIHKDPKISKVCVSTLKLMACKKNAGKLINLFTKYAFSLREDYNENIKYNSSFLTASSDNYEQLLKIYGEILTSWLSYLKKINSSDYEDAKKDGDELYILNGNFKMNMVHNKISNFGSDSSSKKEGSTDITMNSIINTIEQVEGDGLFHLCSRSTKVRRQAITILKIIPKFDDVIYENFKNELSEDDKSNEDNKRSKFKLVADCDTRLINILESVPFFDLISSLRKLLNTPERKLLATIKHKDRKDLLVKLAEADNGVELSLWFKVFPKLLKIVFEKSPVTMALCRFIVCTRLMQLQDFIAEFAATKAANSSVASGLNGAASRLFALYSSNKYADTRPEIIIEQWKLFLIVACSSLTSSGISNTPVNDMGNTLTKAHLRKVSKDIGYSINSATAVFKVVIPLLKSDQPLISDAVHVGLSYININIFKAFVDVIQPIRVHWANDNDKSVINEGNMKLRIEITRILNTTSKFLTEPSIYSDQKMMSELVAFGRTVRRFLGFTPVQESFDYQKLRRYFCGLLENIVEGLKLTPNPEELFPFIARLGCFTYLEEWCGYGPMAGIARERYLKMANDKKYANNPKFSASMEVESSTLEYSAISCMATLCSGAVSKTVNDNSTMVNLEIDYKALIAWIEALFATDNDMFHKLGRKGLKNLLTSNQARNIFSECAKRMYISFSRNIKTSVSYFVAIAEMWLQNENFDCEKYEILFMALYAATSSSNEARATASKVLNKFEKKYYEKVAVAYLTDSLNSSSKAIYKRGAADISKEFAIEYFEDNFKLISLAVKILDYLTSESQLDILTLITPWVAQVNFKRVEFDSGFRMPQQNKRDPNMEMIMNNLIKISKDFASIFPEAFENLVFALVQGDAIEEHSIAILEYIFSICLHKRDSDLVESCKQIIDYVFYTFPDLINVLVSNITPKAMIPPEHRPFDTIKQAALPYIYDLPDTGAKDMFSLGQLSMIFLVDLLRMKSDKQFIAKNLSNLLNISIILLDHYLAIVRNNSIELLCTILHTLAIDNEICTVTIENLRKCDLKYIWSYDDLNNDKNGARTPRNMDILIRTAISILSKDFPLLQKEWGKLTLVWATTCSVRHIACRSFQAFRSLLSFLDRSMLRDMLHRLSNTISDPSPDIQGFAMQILMGLNAITAELSAEQLIVFPELFWSAVACLNTVLEKEFVEVISIISKFIYKIDLSSDDTISCLVSTFPPNWEGHFQGIQKIVMIGLRSSNAWEPSLKLLDRLNKLKSSQVISGENRLMFAFLANMPRFLHALETRDFTNDIKNAAEILSEMAISENQPGVSRIVHSLANNKFRKKDDFIRQSMTFIKETYFPKYQSDCLVFLLGLLMNKIKWVKLETLELLKYLFPLIDLTSETFQGVGADLLSPLLRLLLTEYSEKALEVLDETENISASKLDQDFIRLSLGNRTLRKEFEKIATLFGVPEESGWSIPMPAVTAATTRNNVHAVYLTCRKTINQELENSLLNKPIVESEGVSDAAEPLLFQQAQFTGLESSADMGIISQDYSQQNQHEQQQAQKQQHQQYIPGNELFIEDQNNKLRHIESRDQEELEFYDENPDKRTISHMYATLNYFESFFDADTDGMEYEAENEADSLVMHSRGLSNETSKINNLINEGLDRFDSNSSYPLETFNSNNYATHYAGHYSNYINE